MTRNVEVVILCEDEDHYELVRQHLIACRKYNARQIRRQTKGGFGEVIKVYATEVQAQRSRANHTSASLVVVVDADTGEVEERHEQLATRLKESGGRPRGPDERIAHVVPRRNVETWIVFLNGATVDEQTDYGGQSAEKRRVAAQELGAACASQDPPEPPSLRRSCTELTRLP